MVEVVNVNFPADRKFAFIGFGDLFKCFLKEFHNTYQDKYLAVVISNSDWENEISPGKNTVSDLARACSYDFLDSSGKKSSEMLRTLQTFGANLGLVMGWRFLFRQKFLDHFKGCLLNFHTGDLPRYRGAGGFSWQVLNNEPQVCITIHQMVKAADAGPILFQEKMEISESPIYPKAIMKEREKLALKIVIPKLIQSLGSETNLSLTKQDENCSEYYPMLSTLENGFLDISWDVRFADRFIRAFSYPYRGASIFCHAEKYFIQECSVIEINENLHPYSSGLIANVSPDGIHVVAGKGIIRFERIQNEEEEDVPFSQFKVGERFFNSPEALFNAKLFRARPSV
jgi:methionyl-tRNA formyltransferase